MLQAARKRVPALCGVSSFGLAFLEQLMIPVGLSAMVRFRVSGPATGKTNGSATHR